MFRGLVLAVLMAGLSACASMPNPISVQTRDGIFVHDVGVTWSVDDAKHAGNAAYVEGKQDLIARLQTAVETDFKNSPSGARPITFKIDILNYTRVGAALGNIVGGSNTVAADVTVVQNSDVAILGIYKGVLGDFSSNAGVIGAIAQAISKPDVVGITANSFATNLRARFDGK